MKYMTFPFIRSDKANVFGTTQYTHTKKEAAHLRNELLAEGSWTDAVTIFPNGRIVTQRMIAPVH